MSKERKSGEKRVRRIHHEALMRSFLQRHTAQRLEEFRQYVQEFESKFRRDIAALDKRFGKEAEGRTSEEQQFLAEWYAEDRDTIGKGFVRIFRSSLVVALHAMLETSMDSLCRRLARMKDLPLGLEELSGAGIIRAHTYLEKVCGVEMPKKHWPALRNLGLLRNCIVHAEGDVSAMRNAKKLGRVVANTKGLSLKEDRHLQMGEGYLDAAIEQVENYLCTLYGCAFQKNRPRSTE